jgi:nitrite reductase/ring-hydroxylating ferredoxin subunit
VSGFERLAPLGELPPNETKVIDHRGQKVMLVRVGDEVLAYDARCPHAKTIIPAGPIRDGAIECPMHGAVFAACDGARLDGPTCADLTRWPARVVDGFVEADVPERVVTSDWRPPSWGPVGRPSTGQA